MSSTPPNKGDTSVERPQPDGETIEAVVLTLASSDRALPVRVCPPTKHAHKDRDGNEIPCHSPGKRPVDNRWQDQDFNTAMSAFPKWIERGHNVGIAPTGTLIGLDEDVPGGLDTFFARAGETPPVTMTDSVPTTGKRHMFVRIPKGTDPATLNGVFEDDSHRKLGEVARNGARQLVAPGSVWTDPAISQYAIREWNGVDTIAELSPKVVALLQKRGTNGALKPEANGLTITVGTKWDDSMGSRHEYLLRKIRFWRGTGLTGQPLRDAVIAHIEQIGMPLEKDGRALDSAEIERMCQGAEQKYTLDELPGAAAAQVKHSILNAATDELVIVSTSQPSPTAGLWLVEDMIRPQQLGVLAATEGLGKSWIRLELALRMAGKGGLLLDRYAIATTGSRVLLFDEDNGHDIEHDREEDMLAALGMVRSDLGDRYGRYSFVGTNLDTPEGQAAFEARIERFKPDLVLIDTGGQVVGEEYGPTFKAAMSFLRQVTLRQHCTILSVVHHVKGAKDKNGMRQTGSIQDVMGWWAKPADFVMQLDEMTDQADRDDLKAMWSVRKRNGSSRYVVQQVDGLWRAVASKVEAKGVGKRKGAQDIISALLTKPRKVDGPGGVMEWLESMADAPSKRTVFNILKGLESDGHAESSIDGVWSLTDDGVSAFGLVRLSL